MNKRISTILLTAGMLLVGLASAQMTVISNIKGHVYDTWGLPLQNVTVTAWVGGTLRGSATTQDDFGSAYFNIDVNGTINELGQTITFQVDGVAGVENASFALWIGDQNFTLHQAPVNHSILINEFKTGAGGWIELYNNDSYATNLRNWSLGGGSSSVQGQTISLSYGWNLVSLPLEDGGSSSGVYTPASNTMIQSQGFALFTANLTSMVLDGSAGNITLTNPVGAFRDNTTYNSSSFNVSWLVFPSNGSVGRLVDGSLVWTYFLASTPGYSNIL